MDPEQESMDLEPVLEVRGITKTFPEVVANFDINFKLMGGQIHCLLGENGAGKSTLMNVVFGLYQPDPGGQLFVSGREVSFDSSADAIAQGIGMVHQHFQLIPVLSVVENVVLGDELKRGPMLDLKTASARITELSETFGLHVDPDAMVGDLSVGQQQRVELIKALFREADILILDEPTAVLTPGEVDAFFDVVASLIKQGKSIVFITHKLREVLAVADQITVLRGGKVAGTADPETATQASLASLMVGRDVVFEVEKGPANPKHGALSITNLNVNDDRGAQMTRDLSFDVRAGEIFGIAGVEGNGQRELVEAVTGMRTPESGSIFLNDVDITHLSPRKVADMGVGHIPEDREKHGSIGSLDIADNLILNRYHKAPYSKFFMRNEAAIAANATEQVENFDIRTPGIDTPVGNLSGGNRQKVIVARELSMDLELLVAAQPTRGLDVGSIEFIHNRYQTAPYSKFFMRNEAAIAANATEQVENFDIRTPGIDTPVGNLSGGNRQKVIVARELSMDLELLVAAQPTRGLDVGSIEFIHNQIVARRDEGVAVLLVSAELDEILSLADRIGVIYHGNLLEIMDRADATRERIGLLMAGGSEDGAAA